MYVTSSKVARFTSVYFQHDCSPTRRYYTHGHFDFDTAVNYVTLIAISFTRRRLRMGLGSIVSTYLSRRRKFQSLTNRAADR